MSRPLFPGFVLTITGVLTLMSLSACQTPPVSPGGPVGGIEIRIAHINDHHSNLEPHPDFEIVVAGVPTRVEAGGFPRLTALFKAQAGNANLLKIHAGDAMTGTLYHTLYTGEADAALMNTVCFDAFELGNHEFDEGDAGLRRFLDHLRRGPCRTPVLAANVEPLVGTPLAPLARGDYLRPHVLKDLAGVRVGIVGIEVRDKTMRSSRPLPTTRFDDEVATAQRVINELRAQGVRHIVLATHQGYEADKRMAARLSGVDVIVGGDSHTLLGEFSDVGIAAAGPYPTIARNLDGDLVCIAQAWEYAKAFGLLKVSFDEEGGSSLAAARSRCRSATISGNGMRAATSILSMPSPGRRSSTGCSRPTVSDRRPDPAAQAELRHYTGRLDDMKRQKIGTASDALCLVRVPGEATNRSSGVAGCEAANTLARGSDVAQAVAEAYRQASKLADIALQNGGGIRTPLPAGDVTFNTAYTVLPFLNVLFELRLSGAQVIDVLEDAVANHLDRGSSDGSHPYAAGLRWHLDLSQPRGRRFSEVEVKDKASGVWTRLDPQKPTRW